MTGRQVLEAGQASARKWVRILVIVVVTLMILTALFWANRTVAQHDTCVAVDQNNQILEKLTKHSRERSIKTLRAGVTTGTTTENEINKFFNPTLDEINDVHC